MTKEPHTMPESSQHVFREEFDAFQRTVTGDIKGLLEAIKAESQARFAQVESLRTDIKDVTKTQGRPQYQALSLSFGVFSFVLMAISGVFAWGLSGRADLARVRTKHIEEASILRHAIQETQIDDIAQRIGIIEAYDMEHEAEVRDTNARQSEKLAAVERVVYAWTGKFISNVTPGLEFTK